MADEKKFRLSNLSLDEVSFVDSPANKLAKVILFKRAMPEVEKTLQGVQFQVGFAKSGSDIQSVVFAKAHWTKETSKTWLNNHHLAATRMTDTETALHYHLQDPKAFGNFRTITPGVQMSKAMYSMDNSYGKTMGAVDSAIRQKFQRTTYNSGAESSLANYLMVRDLVGDSVFFEQNGSCYRAEYSVDRGGDGELEVTLGEKVPVELVYRDINKREESADEPMADEALIFKLGQMKAKLAHLDKRISRLSKTNPTNVLHLVPKH